MFAYEILKNIATPEESACKKYSWDTVMKAMVKYNRHQEDIRDLLVNEKGESIGALIKKYKNLK